MTFSGSMFQVDNEQSTNIGFRPHFTTQRAVAIIEKDGIITSEFFFKFKALIATSNAAVPLETATPNFLEFLLLWRHLMMQTLAQLHMESF